MADTPNRGPNTPEPTEADLDNLEQSLHTQAAQWRERLADPVLAQAVREGRIVINPLVQNLLDAFPPA